MKSYMSSLLAVACLMLAADAGAITTGSPLPELAITEPGEIKMNGDSLSWAPWSSSKLTGQARVIEYLAARMSSRKMNQAFMKALDTRAALKARNLSITIVNMDDALWGTSGLVPGEIQKKKQANPAEIYVVDAKGQGLKTWHLKRESSAIIVLDKTGKVVFFKQGTLTKQEIETTLKLVESLSQH